MATTSGPGLLKPFCIYTCIHTTPPAGPFAASNIIIQHLPHPCHACHEHEARMAEASLRSTCEAKLVRLKYGIACARESLSRELDDALEKDVEVCEKYVEETEAQMEKRVKMCWKGFQVTWR
ncbi:MAG: hypothetical protein M1833_004726 [Piccolia ochrophora]|nr:MAG: hypothetical protein M1833_004726 [Piccolia ochrophora]